MSQALRVVFVVSSYPRYPGDSASVFLHHLAVHLRHHGITVTVLAPDDAQATQEPLDGVTVQRFRYALRRSGQRLAYGSGMLPNLKHQPWLYLQLPVFMLALTWRLWRVSRQLRPDVLHAHWVIPQGLPTVILGRWLRVPVVLTAHGSDTLGMPGTKLAHLRRWIVNRAQAWTANSRATATALAQPPPRLTPSIIPMGINLAQFAQAQPVPRPADKQVLLYVGRLIEKKGVRVLFDAYTTLDSTVRAQTVLWIVGSGDLQAELSQQAQGLPVHFWGAMPNAELPALYAAADLVVMPSLSEGQGVVALEALASGKALLASQVDGLAEMLRHEVTAYLVPPGEVTALKDALLRLIGDPSLRTRLASQGQSWVQAHYDWPQVAARFAQLYRELVRRP
jgi:glycosyltransferase involved in cell wall biosynthesis